MISRAKRQSTKEAFRFPDKNILCHNAKLLPEYRNIKKGIEARNMLRPAGE